MDVVDVTGLILVSFSVSSDETYLKKSDAVQMLSKQVTWFELHCSVIVDRYDQDAGGL